MSAYLTASIIPGKGMTGYKVYSNTTNVYGGASSGLHSSQTQPLAAASTNKHILLNYNAPIQTSGQITKLLMGFTASHAVSAAFPNIRVIVYDITNVAGEIVFTQNSYSTVSTYVNLDLDEEDTLELTLSSPLNVTAGQVIGISIDAVGTNYTYMQLFYTSLYPLYYIYTSTIPTTFNMSDAGMTNDQYLATDPGVYSFEVIGEWLEEWTEITTGGCGSTTITTIPITTATYTTDLGDVYDLSTISFNSSTIGSYMLEILISDEDTVSPTTWTSIYYGIPRYYGHVYDGGTYQIGFPFTARHIRFISANTGPITCTGTIYTYSTEFDGYQFPLSASTGHDHITVNPGEIDTQPYWYRVVPVSYSLNIGSASVPVSNRINIL